MSRGHELPWKVTVLVIVWCWRSCFIAVGNLVHALMQFSLLPHPQCQWWNTPGQADRIAKAGLGCPHGDDRCFRRHPKGRGVCDTYPLTDGGPTPSGLKYWNKIPFLQMWALAHADKVSAVFKHVLHVCDVKNPHLEGLSAAVLAAIRRNRVDTQVKAMYDAMARVNEERAREYAQKSHTWAKAQADAEEQAKKCEEKRVATAKALADDDARQQKEGDHEKKKKRHANLRESVLGFRTNNHETFNKAVGDAALLSELKPVWGATWGQNDADQQSVCLSNAIAEVCTGAGQGHGEFSDAADFIITIINQLCSNAKNVDITGQASTPRTLPQKVIKRIEKLQQDAARLDAVRGLLKVVSMPEDDQATAPEPARTTAPELASEPAPTTAPETTPTTVPEPAPEPAATTALETTPTTAPEPAPEPARTTVPEPAPEPAATTAPETTPITAPAPAPEPAQTTSPEVTPTAAPEPAPSAADENGATTKKKKTKKKKKKKKKKDRGPEPTSAPPVPILSGDPKFGKLGTERLRDCVDNVAAPLLIRLFNDWWSRNYNICWICKTCRNGDFDNIKLCCLTSLFAGDIGPDYRLLTAGFMEAVTRHAGDPRSGEHLMWCFDIQNLKDTVKVCRRLHPAMVDSRQEPMNDLCEPPSALDLRPLMKHGRHAAAHDTRLTLDQANPAIDIVRKSCVALAKHLLKTRAFSELVPLVSDAPSTSLTDLATVQDLFEDCASGKSDVSRVKFYRYMAEKAANGNFGERYDGLVEGFAESEHAKVRRAASLADKLKGKSEQGAKLKMLIIPPMDAEAKAKFAFLKLVVWDKVFDCSDGQHWKQDGPAPRHRKTNYLRPTRWAQIIQEALEQTYAIFILCVPSGQGVAQCWKDLEGYADVLHLQANPLFVIADETRAFTNTGDLASAYCKLARLDASTDRTNVAELTSWARGQLCDVQLLQQFVYAESGGQVFFLPGAEPARLRPVERKQWDQSRWCECAELLHRTIDNSVGVARDDLRDKFHQMETPADWSLFGYGSTVAKRTEVKKIVDHFLSNAETCVQLVHAYASGGTTVARNALYELRSSFVCVAMSKFPGADKDEQVAFQKVIRGFHKKTGLRVLLLVDHRNSEREHESNFRANFRKLADDNGSFCSMLECVHYSDTQPNKCNAAWKEITLGFPTPQQAVEIRKSMSQHSTVRKILLEFDGIEPRELVAGGDYMDANGDVDTAKIKQEAGRFNRRRNWQAILIDKSRNDHMPLLQDCRLTPLEIFELSSTEGQAGRWPAAPGMPLIHCGLLSMDHPGASDVATRYTDRIRIAINNLLKGMEPGGNDVALLKLAVFAALFAPGCLIDTSLVTQEAELSATLTALVRSMGNSPRSRGHLIAVHVPKLAELLGEHEMMFGNAGSGHTMDQQKLLDYVNGPFLNMLDRYQRGPMSGSGVELRVGHPIALVRVAFTQFRIWHFTGFAPPPAPDPNRASAPLRFSLLVEIMRNNGFAADAADSYERVARKFQNEEGRAMEETYGMTCIELVTHASRLREAHVHAQKYGTHDDSHRECEKEFQKCLDLLDTLNGTVNGQPLRVHGKVYHRRGMVHRRRLQSLCAQSQRERQGKQGKQGTLTPQEDRHLSSLVRRSWENLENAAKSGSWGWSYPIVSMVQLQLLLFEHLQGSLQQPGNMAAMTAFLTSPVQSTLVDGIEEVFDPAQCIELLRLADIACKYIKVNAVEESTRRMIQQAIVSLKRLWSPMPPEHRQNLALCDQNVRMRNDAVQVRDELLFTARDRLKRLQTSAKTSARFVGTLLEAIVELSTTLAALTPKAPGSPLSGAKRPFASVRITSREETDGALDYLSNTSPGAQLPEDIACWESAVDGAHFHGLGPFVANAMLALFDCANCALRMPKLDSSQKVSRLRQTIERLEDRSKLYERVHTTLYFLADSCAIFFFFFIEDQPLTAFVSVEACTHLKSTRGGNTGHAAYVNAFEAASTNGVRVRRFEGLIRLDPSGGSRAFVTFCVGQAEPMDIRFTLRSPNTYPGENQDEFDDGQSVTFSIGLKYSGIWAHGVTKL